MITMLKIARSSLLAAALGAALPGVAAADEVPLFTGGDVLTHTTYSGWAGRTSHIEESLFPGAFGLGGVAGISWWEDGDQPCQIRLHLRSLKDGREGTNGEDENSCNGSASNRKTVGFFDNPRMFVRGIAVCSSKSNRNEQRMKGIKLYGAKVWLSKPEVEEVTTTAVEDHVRCGTWNAPVFCPADTVATGLVIERVGSSITGLGLSCRPVHYLSDLTSRSAS